MSTSHPTVSILVPCYNGQPYLGEALQSALDQTFQDFELVVVDNQSTDLSYKEALDFASRDPRIRVIQNEKNLGMSGNWNRSLTYARGKYVKILCADDLLRPTCLAESVAVMEAHPDVSVVTSLSQVVNADGKPVWVRNPPFADGTPIPHDLVFQQCFLQGTNIIGETSITFFRKSAIDQVQGFDPSLHYLTDLDYTLALLKHGNLWKIDRANAAYRVHTSSMTTQMLDRVHSELWQVFEKHSSGNLGLQAFIAKNRWKFTIASHFKRRAKRIFMSLCQTSLGSSLLEKVHHRA